MANRQWLEEVKRQLVENRLPSTYIGRFMEELSDHLEDLMEETMRNEKDCVTQLGEPAQVADAAVVAYCQRTFFGRHPVVKFLAFGVSPLPAMILAFVAAMAGTFFLCSLGLKYYETPVGSFMRSLDDPVSSGTWFMSITTLTLPATLLAIFYCIWAKRSKLSKRWILLSCIIISTVSMLVSHQFAYSEITDKGTYSIGLGLPPTAVQQYVQLLVPLAVGLWYMQRGRKQSPTDAAEKPLQAAA